MWESISYPVSSVDLQNTQDASSGSHWGVVPSMRTKLVLQVIVCVRAWNTEFSSCDNQNLAAGIVAIALDLCLGKGSAPHLSLPKPRGRPGGDRC